MSINSLFGLVFVLLLTIIVAFEQKVVSTGEPQNEVALLNISNFTMYEMDKTRLTSLLKATDGIRYADRFLLKDINYTDNSKELRANIVSKNGIYKDNVLTLNGDVFYKREDDITFKSQSAKYDKTSSDFSTKENFEATMQKNIAYGSEIEYNNETKKLKSKNVYVIYKIEDKKR